MKTDDTLNARGKLQCHILVTHKLIQRKLNNIQIQIDLNENVRNVARQFIPIEFRECGVEIENEAKKEGMANTHYHPSQFDYSFIHYELFEQNPIKSAK